MGIDNPVLKCLDGLDDINHQGELDTSMEKLRQAKDAIINHLTGNKEAGEHFDTNLNDGGYDFIIPLEGILKSSWRGEILLEHFKETQNMRSQLKLSGSDNEAEAKKCLAELRDGATKKFNPLIDALMNQPNTEEILSGK